MSDLMKANYDLNFGENHVYKRACFVLLGRSLPSPRKKAAIISIKIAAILNQQLTHYPLLGWALCALLQLLIVSFNANCMEWTIVPTLTLGI